MIWDSAKDNRGNGPPGQARLDATSRLEGKLLSSEAIILDGRIRGDVSVSGTLEITKNAEVNGSVKADKLSICGKMEGDIDVADSLSIGKTAIVQGDIKAGTLDVAEGAIIRGQCSIGGTSPNHGETEAALLGDMI